MPRSVPQLKDVQCRQAKPRAKAYRMSDGQGLYLEVAPNGSKYWRLKYLLHKTEKRFAMGVYPEVSLIEARQLREAARKLVAQGIDPVQDRRIEKRKAAVCAGNTFELVARDWFNNYRISLIADTAHRCIQSLEKDVFPYLGKRPIADIKTAELLPVIRAIETRGAREVAARVLQRCHAIFRYAAQTGISENNPAANMRGALKPQKTQHHKYLKESDLPEFLMKLESNSSNLDVQTLLAMELMLLTFVRTSELRGARWEEFNLEEKKWYIPAERMKMKDPHVVPLSRQALQILAKLKPISGHRAYVFPNLHKPLQTMSENTILFALYRMGYHSRATGHGFRATASTILNANKFNSDYIERQLAHRERNEVRAAYNHADYLDERTAMMQWYADHIDTLRGRGQVIEFPARQAA